MSTSILLAKILGPVLCVVGVGILLNRKYYKKMVDQFLKSPETIFIAGLINLVAGVAIVVNHNIWGSGWPLAITVLGWAVTIRGVIMIVAPNQLIKAAKVHINDTLFTLTATLVIVLGVMFNYVVYSQIY